MQINNNYVTEYINNEFAMQVRYVSNLKILISEYFERKKISEIEKN